MSSIVKYEIVNKSTKDAFPVEAIEFGNGIVTVKTSAHTVVFKNEDAKGELENNDYLIREIGTHKRANGVGIEE